MSGDLAVAIVLFVGAAVVVFFFGSLLAKYGDALATLTGWGRLFVGSILLALATSLPELLTNISAVRLDPPNPELGLGNILGANMINMFTLAIVALLFGGKRFLQRVSPEQRYLIVLAVAMTGAAILFGAVNMEVSLWQVGLSSVIILALYVVGMRIVYVTRPQKKEDHGVKPGMTSQRAWLMFGVASLGVVAAAPVLAYSTDQIAEITGVASSTLGILAVALVTTMPEASATIAAARMGAMDLGVSGLFGSCAINVTILFYADPFYREGILTNQTEAAHFVAGGIAVGLMLAGLLLILSRNRLRSAVAAGGLALMVSAYLAGAAVVAALGTPEESSGEPGEATVQYQDPPQAGL